MSAFRYDPPRRQILNRDDKVIASVGDGIGSVVANKMAAAHDLLEALIGLIGLVELIIPTLEGSQRIGVEQNHRLEAARAVLARAKGETP